MRSPLMAFYLSIFISLSYSLSAQPDNETVMRLLDSYELIPGGQQPLASEMYAGEGLIIREGAYLRAGRQEFLCVVPLAKGDKKSSFAFIGFRDTEGIWQRSGWFELGFWDIRAIDVDGDGVKELILETRYAGSKISKFSYKLLSVLNDEKKELFDLEGFDLSETARGAAKAGDVLSGKYDVLTTDINGDGKIDLTVNFEEEIFQYEDNNANAEFDIHAQRVVDNVRLSQTIYMYKKGEYVKVVPKD